MKELTIQIPETPYYDTDVIIGLMKENHIAFKSKYGEHTVMPLGSKKLSLEENEKVFNIAIDLIRSCLVKQGLLLELGKDVEIVCLNCRKKKLVSYKYRHNKFCSLSCSSSYNTKKLHKEGKINVDRNETGRFIKSLNWDISQKRTNER